MDKVMLQLEVVGVRGAVSYVDSNGNKHVPEYWLLVKNPRGDAISEIEVDESVFYRAVTQLFRINPTPAVVAPPPPVTAPSPVSPMREEASDSAVRDLDDDGFEAHGPEE